MDAAAKTSAVPVTTAPGDGATAVAQQPGKQTQPVADQKPERKPVQTRQDDKWKIFSGTANDALAKDICEFLDLKLGQACISQVLRRRDLCPD